MYGLLFAFSLFLVRITFMDPAPALKKGHGFWREQRKGAVAVFAGMAGTMIVPNVIALIMREVLNKGMSWFRNELAPIGLYGPAALLGLFILLSVTISDCILTPCPSGCMISQYLVGEVHEQSVFTAMLLIQALIAFVVQMANIGSAAIFFLIALPLFMSLAINPLFSGTNGRLSLGTYALGQMLPALTGGLLLLGVLDVFVPLVRQIPS